VAGVIPVGLGELSLLERLWLNSNLLSGTIPRDVFQIRSLKGLSLSSNDLTGALPHDLGQLSNLTTLHLHWNPKLSGSLPSQIGMLTKMNELFLHDTNVSGTIPAELGQLSLLHRLRLSNNQLSGTLPGELCGLSSLSILRISYNHITGSLPESCRMLSNPKMDQLYLDNNHITGTIPAALGQNIKFLVLHDNNLTGTIPPELSALSKLERLIISNNQISGTIPHQMSKLSALVEFTIDHNNIGGTLSPELSNLSKIERMYFNNNQLTGSIPREFGQLASESANGVGIYLSSNRLTGSIPLELGKIKDFNGLAISDNNITGAIPVELFARNSTLSILQIDNNGISGTIPFQIGNLALLSAFQAQSNALSGTIPEELCNLQKMTVLQLNSNSLVGSIPRCIGNLTKLRCLSLSDNSLTRSIMPVGNLRYLEQLWLSNNQLTGTLPDDLGLLKNLQMLYLHNNSLSGTLPSSLGNCSSLGMLSVYLNRISGSLPESLGQLGSLIYLWAGENRLSGSIPRSFGQLTSLVELSLRSNSLSGSVPSEIGGILLLEKLVLHVNRLSGTMPATISKLAQLATLTMSDNNMFGPLPSTFPSSLRHLVLHRNFFSGVLPSFKSNRRLETLTLFQQELYGRLVLPSEAPNLSVVMVHSNRLSCAVEANYTMLAGEPIGYSANLSQAQNLLGPGNSFSHPPVEWAATSSVAFLWSDALLWDEWFMNLMYFFCGGVATGVVVTTNYGMRQFVCFSSKHGIESMQWFCCSIGLMLTLLFFPILTTLYAAGSNLFECGKQSSRMTIAYLKDDPVLEWCVACFAVIFAFVGTNAVLLFQKKAIAEYPQQKEVGISRLLRLQVFAVWSVVMLFLGAFPALYAVGHSIPEDNVWGISAPVLQFVTTFAGAIMVGIDYVVTPTLATFIVHAFHGDSDAKTSRAFIAKSVAFAAWKNTVGDTDSEESRQDLASEIDFKATELMLHHLRPRYKHTAQIVMFTRMMMTIIIPGAVTIAVNQDCYSGWLGIWTTCQNQDNFNLGIQLSSPGLAGGTRVYMTVGEGNNAQFVGNKIRYKSTMQFIGDKYIPGTVVYYFDTGNPGRSVAVSQVPVTSHADICAPLEPSRCSRAVVETLGALVVAKLFFTAFVSPVLSLLLDTKLGQKLMFGLENWSELRPWSTPRIRQTIDLSTEVVDVTMLLEHCLVLGFFVPVVLPLASIALMVHAAVFHQYIKEGARLLNDATPSPVYLYWSLMMGCTSSIWFFVQNDLHGQVLVAVMVPVMVLVAFGMDQLTLVERLTNRFVLDEDEAGDQDGAFTTKPELARPHRHHRHESKSASIQMSELPTMGTVQGLSAAPVVVIV